MVGSFEHKFQVTYGVVLSHNLKSGLDTLIKVVLKVWTIDALKNTPIGRSHRHKVCKERLNVNKKLIKEGDVHTHPVWRSVECAIASTRRIVRIAEKHNKKAHVLHITTKEEIDFLSQHKGNITFEITPQHLTLYAPDCYDKLGTYAQMNPPLRDKSHYDRLWYGVRNNFNDTIGSDHAPHLKENKDARNN